MKLTEKTIVISGGNGGIGSALVEALHEKGAKVYSLDVDGKIPHVIEGVHYIPVDLENAEWTKQSVELIKGKVNIVILNTGVMRRGTIFDSSEQDYDALFGANIKASWMLLKYIHSKLAEDAAVVQVSSGHALNPEADPGLYTLTKKATVALAEMVALTNPNYDVRIVYPGPILTKLLLSGRTDSEKKRVSKIAMPPDEFAEKVVEFLESDKKTLRFEPDDFSYRLV